MNNVSNGNNNFDLSCFSIGEFVIGTILNNNVGKNI